MAVSSLRMALMAARPSFARAIVILTGVIALLAALFGLAVGVATRMATHLAIVVDATLPPQSAIELSVDPTLIDFSRSPSGRGNRERFEFPLRPRRIGFLRLDPGTAPGIVRLHSVEIWQRGWRGSGRLLGAFSADQLGKWSSTGIARMQVTADGALEITSHGHDPQLIAPAIDFELRAPTTLSSLLASFNEDDF